jgi:DNA-directed RNA polymerase subunit L
MTKYKRKLDDQAKIFSLSFNKQDTSMFRISISLNEKIESKILKEAVNETIKYFKDFKVKIKKGLLWHYFIENNQEILIHREEEYDFKNIHNKDNNYYLFKIIYEDNTISIDYFHLLTDGLRANKFLTEIASFS